MPIRTGVQPRARAAAQATVSRLRQDNPQYIDRKARLVFDEGLTSIMSAIDFNSRVLIGRGGRTAQPFEPVAAHVGVLPTANVDTPSRSSSLIMPSAAVIPLPGDIPLNYHTSLGVVVPEPGETLQGALIRLRGLGLAPERSTLPPLPPTPTQVASLRTTHTESYYHALPWQIVAANSPALAPGQGRATIQYNLTPLASHGTRNYTNSADLVTLAEGKRLHAERQKHAEWREDEAGDLTDETQPASAGGTRQRRSSAARRDQRLLIDAVNRQINEFRAAADDDELQPWRGSRDPRILGEQLDQDWHGFLRYIRQQETVLVSRHRQTSTSLAEKAFRIATNKKVLMARIVWNEVKIHKLRNELRDCLKARSDKPAPDISDAIKAREAADLDTTKHATQLAQLAQLAQLQTDLQSAQSQADVDKTNISDLDTQLNILKRQATTQREQHIEAMGGAAQHLQDAVRGVQRKLDSALNDATAALRAEQQHNKARTDTLRIDIDRLSSQVSTSDDRDKYRQRELELLNGRLRVCLEDTAQFANAKKRLRHLNDKLTKQKVAYDRQINLQRKTANDVLREANADHNEQHKRLTIEMNALTSKGREEVQKLKSAHTTSTAEMVQKHDVYKEENTRAVTALEAKLKERDDLIVDERQHWQRTSDEKSVADRRVQELNAELISLKRQRSNRPRPASLMSVRRYDQTTVESPFVQGYDTASSGTSEAPIEPPILHRRRSSSQSTDTRSDGATSADAAPLVRALTRKRSSLTQPQLLSARQKKQRLSDTSDSESDIDHPDSIEIAPPSEDDHEDADDGGSTIVSDADDSDAMSDVEDAFHAFAATVPRFYSLPRSRAASRILHKPQGLRNQQLQSFIR